jgi:hypothetical protein
VYVDGVKVGEVLDSQVPTAYSGDKYIAWGITGTTALGEDANWSRVSFETGQHPVVRGNAGMPLLLLQD